MYFDAPESHVPISIQPDSGLLISMNGLAVLALGIMPGTFMSVCAVAGQQALMLRGGLFRGGGGPRRPPGNTEKPILFSIVFSPCHWCHVMAHESFEDASVAAV